MSEQPHTAQPTGAPLTPEEEDLALQQAARREAATRPQPDTQDQVFDTGNERGMGSGRGDRGGSDDDDQG